MIFKIKEVHLDPVQLIPSGTSYRNFRSKFLLIKLKRFYRKKISGLQKKGKNTPETVFPGVFFRLFLILILYAITRGYEIAL